MDKKILIVFDFDNTIIDENCDITAFNLIKNQEERLKLWNSRCEGQWTEFMNTILNQLHLNNVKKNDLKTALGLVKLVTGMQELFALIQNNSNLYHCVIISDANTWFINVILEKYGIKNLPKQVISNKGVFDNSGKLVVIPCHQHTHNECPVNMCKGILLDEFRKSSDVKYDHVCYIGDGGNDFCPCANLAKSDLVCAREDFALHNKIMKLNKNGSNGLNAPVLIWNSAFEIIKKLDIFN